MEVFLKVDVDTKKGFLQGVPVLLDVLKRQGVCASFYVAMGPDNSGRAIRRIFRPGFLAKMLRTHAASAYGFPTLIYGVFWPGPMIGLADPGLLHKIAAEGHELGIHGFDHVLWHDKLHGMDEGQIKEQVDHALDVHRRVMKGEPWGFAAPGWTWNRCAQEVFGRYPFLYTSNTRGSEPFFPVYDGTVYPTLEVPTSLPTLDEVLGNKARSPEELTSFFLKKMHHGGTHVLTVHAELEGQKYAGWFERLLRLLLDDGVSILPLRDLAKRCLARRDQIPRCDIYPGAIDGRAIEVALQGLCARLPVPERP